MSTGQISMSDLNGEFGGGYSLSNYYRNGSYVTSNDYAPNDPTSGPISFSSLQGAKKNSYQGIGFGSSQYWTVPYTSSGSVNAYVQGGGGGGGNAGFANGYPYGDGGPGGAGGIASQTIGVTPGATYYVTVGGGGSKGSWAYGYKDNPRADGFRGYGGGGSNFNGVYAGGGGGGGGGDPGQTGGAGGGPYGGGGGAGQVINYDSYNNLQSSANFGGAGSGSGNYLGWGGQPGYGVGGQGSINHSGVVNQWFTGGDSTSGTQGVVYVYGYW